MAGRTHITHGSSERLIPLDVFGRCHSINVTLRCSALPSASATPQQYAGLPRLTDLSAKTFITTIPCRIRFWQRGLLSSSVCIPVLPTSVFGFMYPQFLMFSHGTTRWPSHKIHICCCMFMATETSFLASGDASLVLSFLVLLVEFFVSYLLNQRFPTFLTRGALFRINFYGGAP